MSMSYSMRSLLKFFVYIVFLAHWAACAHRLLPQMEQTERPMSTAPQWPDVTMNWMDAYGVDYIRKALDGDGVNLIDNPSFVGDWDMYTISLYWSCMTLSTIGYGDIPVRTHSERVLAIICMVLGAGTYAYMVGAICGIVASMDPLGAEFNQTMDSLNDYMSEMALPTPLRWTLRAYFYHCRHRLRIRSYHTLLEQMSPALRGAVAAFVHGPALEQIYFFVVEGSDETPTFITQISMCMEAEAYGPQENVIATNSVADRMFIVDAGLASKEGLLFTKGSFFGEDFILTDARREYSVLAVNFLDVYTVQRDKLYEILDNFWLPKTRAKIRLAMIRLAFFRRIRPLIYQMWKEDKLAPEVSLPASWAKRRERLEQQCLDAPEIVELRTTAECELDARVDELQAVVGDAARLRPHELGALVGVMGTALNTLSNAAAAAMMAATRTQESKPIFKARRLSGFDLDDAGHGMGQDNYAVATEHATPGNVGRKL